ncbi:PAS domain S-box protein [Veronia pacifica]|uniref:histidine kinase n=1 Tax=Veronia pacifica TaxID=1080227 RepID=A0A1C3EAA6_9GAMM|nr:PAS domain S-box protein [Veronia pacifica]ODA30175.1 hypothetical protein A8L45_20970 [Veronia pacifica]
MITLDTFLDFYRAALSPTLALVPLIDPWLMLTAFFCGFINLSLALHFRPMLGAGETFFALPSYVITGLVFAVGIWCTQSVALVALTPPGASLSWPTLVVSFAPALLGGVLFMRRSALPESATGLSFRFLFLLAILLGTLIVSLVSLPSQGFSLQHQPRILLCVFAALAFAMFSLLLTGHHVRWKLIPMTRALIAGTCLALSVVTLNLAAGQCLVISGSQSNAITPELDRIQSVTFLLAVTVVTYVAALAACLHVNARGHHRALKKYTEKLEKTLNALQEALITTGKQGSIISFSQTADVLFGWTSEEVIGRNIRMLISDESRHLHDEQMKRFTEYSTDCTTQGSTLELVALKKNGESFPARISFELTMLDGESLFVFSISDISEQQQINQSLRENAKQYRTLISNLPALTFREMARGKRQLVYVSDAAKQLTGFTASSLTGEHGGQSFIDHLHQDDVQEYLRGREELIRQCCQYELEYRFIGRDGQERWFLELGNSYRIQDGTVWIDGLILDITERKQKALTMVEKVAQAERLTESKSAFLHNMGTEFRTPLNAMLGLTEIMLASEQSSEQRKHLEVILRSGNTLLTLVNDAVEAARFESQTVSLDITEFSLLPLCRQIEFIACETALTERPDILLCHSSRLAENYLGDARRIKQLFHNMVTNTLSARPSAALRLHVYPWQQGIRFAVSAHSSVELSEQKGGKFMTSKVMSHLVELMDGFLWYDEKKNVSVMYVDLPLAPSGQVKEVKHADKYRHLLTPADIVVIDPLQRNQREISQQIIKKGASVTTFPDLPQALKAMENRMPDIVLVDAYLSDLPSLKRVFSNNDKGENTFSMPIIVGLTVSADPSTLSSWNTRGVDAVISKPIEPQDLVAELEKIADQTQANHKVTPIPTRQDDLFKPLFNSHLALEHWQTKSLYAQVIEGYWFRYRNIDDLASHLAAHSDKTQSRIERARASALCMGFERFDLLLERAQDAHRYSRNDVFSQTLEQLSDCLDASFEKACSFVGIRPFENKEQKPVPSKETVLREAGPFVIALSKGQLDESCYRKLIPDLVQLTDPSELVHIIRSLENFDFEDARQRFEILLERLSSTPDPRSSYGV